MRIRVSQLPEIIGQEVGVSDWLLIDQERVNRFAEATDDFQWIHVDVERATRERGGTIAHGYLTLSLVPHFISGLLTYEDLGYVLNYGADRLRFPAPVKVGSRIRARQTVKAVERRGDGFQVLFEVVIEIEGGEKPALVMDLRMLVYG